MTPSTPAHEPKIGLLTRKDHDRLTSLMAAIHRVTNGNDLIENPRTSEWLRGQLIAEMPGRLSDVERQAEAILKTTNGQPIKLEDRTDA